LQLFGSPKQAKLAIELAYNIQKGGTFLLDDLMNDLRSDLRAELNLPHIDGNAHWLRLNNKKHTLPVL